MLIQCLIILGLFQLIINGKSLRNMEAIRLLDRNDASCKRTSYIHTKHRMNLNYFLSVKNMLEVLQNDHITVNTAIYCVIQQLLFMSK